MSLLCSDTFCGYVHDYSVDANVIRAQLNGMLPEDVIEAAKSYSLELAEYASYDDLINELVAVITYEDVTRLMGVCDWDE